MAFSLYRASAGSGKTFTLVKEYLKIVLKNPDKFKHILAVTFTNKAAGEMKERILQALKILASRENELLQREIKKELPTVTDIPNRSAFVLKQILHNYSDFAIMTIDSFIYRVIKAFSLEFNLPLNSRIEVNKEKIETYIVERIVGDVGKDEFMTHIILQFVFSKIIEDKGWNVEGQIKKIDREILNEKNVNFIRNMSSIEGIEFDRILEQLKKIRTDYISKYNVWGKEALTLIQEAH